MVILLLARRKAELRVLLLKLELGLKLELQAEDERQERRRGGTTGARPMSSSEQKPIGAGLQMMMWRRRW